MLPAFLSAQLFQSSLFSETGMLDSLFSFKMFDGAISAHGDAWGTGRKANVFLWAPPSVLL